MGREERVAARGGAAPQMSRAVVIGVGNPLRGDDAVGPLAAAELRKRAPGHVTVLDSDGDALAMLDAWEGADTVVLVDAVRTGAPAGTVLRWELGQDPVALPERVVSSHGIGIAETLEMARALDRLPERLVVWGVEAAHFRHGARTSPGVVEAVREIVEEILREVGQEG